MQLYRYTDALERYYPDRALTVNQGDEAEWPAPPDPHWTPVDPTSSPPPQAVEPQESDA